MFKCKVLLLLFCCSLSSFSQTKNFQFSHLSTSEGLSQSSAIAIHQDNLGQMWIGTRDGLNKYDGAKFTVYRNQVDNPNSISNNDILSIIQDSEGFIWIGTYNGLNKYNPKTNNFTRYFHKTNSTSLINNTIWTIEELSNGDVWVGTSGGLSIYNRQTDSFTNHLKNRKSDKALSSRVLSILETNNSVFIGTTNGLIKVPDINDINFELIKETEGVYIQDIAKNLSGELLLATRLQSILKYDLITNSLQVYYSEKLNNIKESNVRQLQFDNNGKLWVGTYNGLQVIDNNQNTTFLSANINNVKSLSKNSVKSIFKDKKGSIWIGTYYGGINIWDPTNENFTNIIHTPGGNGLNYNVVSSIANYKNIIYFGTEGGGITRLDTKDNIYSYLNIKNNPELLDNNIKSLFLSKDKNLWIGTFDSGVTVYNPELNSFMNSKITNNLKGYLSDVGVYAIKQDTQGSIWLGTFGKGLIKYNLINKTFKIYRFNGNLENSITSDLVRTIGIDSNENIWVGTERGLSRINSEDKITNYFYDKNLKTGDDILSIYEDNNKVIWVGSKAKGVFKFIESKFKSVNLKLNNTKVSSVYSILEDDTNHLWFSTNQGIVKFNINTEETMLYNQKDGLLSNEFNNNACLKIDDSKFYFGGPAGVTYFDSQHLIINDYVPQVLLTDFKIKQKSVSLFNENSVLKQAITYTKNLELAHNQGNFGISFTIPNFINSNNNSYKYRLKGLEDDWFETSENTVYYTIQNPGDYIFEVKGANSDGIWNEHAKQLLIHVKPAPWRSSWAFLLYSLIILGALYFLISILKSRAKLQSELKLEHLQAEQTKLTNKAKLEFFTNISHEFRTPLTLILGPLHQVLEDYKGSSEMYKKLRVIESSANHLLHLINRLMDFRKLENKLFKLEAAEGNIVKFIKEIYLSFSEFAKDGNYDYSFQTTEDEILVYYDRYKLERVFYNLISNAFRYTPKQGKIVVRIIKKDNQIIIQIEDSGVGVSPEYQDKIFDRFFEVSSNNKPDNNYNKGTGIGLSIAKNIVKLHKGEIGIINNTNGEGSIFYVQLPLGCNHLDEDQIIKDFKFSDDVSQYVNQLDEPEFVLENDIVEELPSKEKLTILLVEDNKPLRKFMRNLLKDKYNLLEAANGKIALNLAQKESPDLIVSDVVMPQMAGTALCTAIKQNLKTSHIPIILLTSRTALVYKLEGLESGADDYLSKPFNVNEFKSRIKNLLESTARIKQKFSSTDPLQPNEVIVSSIDEKLYKKALHIVEANISNAEFDIPFFCEELGVSRTMLFVKIKAWSNFTPNEFIQYFRMKRAAQLLEQGKINVSEVSYKVGFKNPKYFSKCFQKKFGKTPSQYASKFFIN